jgi:hypothetical protein
MIPKSGNRFSEKIMLRQMDKARGLFEEKSSRGMLVAGLQPGTKADVWCDEKAAPLSGLC